MNTDSRKIWETPWGYTEGFVVAGGIALAGLMLQLSIGNIRPELFGAPISIIAGALFTVGLLCFFLFFKNRSFFRWLSGGRATIPAIGVLLVWIIVMGLTPQYADHTAPEMLPRNLPSKLGWYQMTTSWPFVLLCFYLLAVVGLATLRRTTQKPSWRDIGFYLNHAGLYIALLGGMLGSTDMERLTMSVNEGEVEWRATDKLGKMHELPIAIQLDTFMIEEYPPKLVLIHTHTGKMLPKGRPANYLFEGIGKTGQLADKTIEILDYVPQAGIMQDSAKTTVVPMTVNGAAAALKIRVSYPAQRQPVEGWVSNGSHIFPFAMLRLDDGTTVAMPVQEVKKYTSLVTVFTKTGHSSKAAIEVNKPFAVDDWIIYQYSYDQNRGKYSETSIFELVRDPWLKIVYAGIFMLLAGAIFLFVAGPKKSKIINHQS